MPGRMIVTTKESATANPATANPALKLIARAKLPPFPGVALQVMKMVSQDNLSLGKLSQVLETDTALTTEMLRAANSPLFGTRGDVRSVATAVSTLGVDRVSMLILTTAMWRMVPGGPARMMLRHWWRHNLATAFLCQHIAADGDCAEYSYMAGLMHTAGQLAFYSTFPAEYLAILEQAARQGVDSRESERQRFDIDHCELGQALLLEWRIPAAIADAAGHYLEPERGEFPLTLPVHFASQAADQIGCPAVNGAVRPLDTVRPFVADLLKDRKLMASVVEKVESLEGSLSR
jgi:HD-like signal output (HDOD) protein